MTLNQALVPKDQSCQEKIIKVEFLKIQKQKLLEEKANLSKEIQDIDHQMEEIIPTSNPLKNFFTTHCFLSHNLKTCFFFEKFDLGAIVLEELRYFSRTPPLKMSGLSAFGKEMPIFRRRDRTKEKNSLNIVPNFINQKKKEKIQ